MMDHLSGQWKSPYIEYICKLRSKLGLQDEPPTMRYLKRHVTRWALDRANDSISSLNLPFVESLTAFKRAEYVVSHRFLLAFGCQMVGLATSVLWLVYHKSKHVLFVWTVTQLMRHIFYLVVMQ